MQPGRPRGRGTSRAGARRSISRPPSAESGGSKVLRAEIAATSTARPHVRRRARGGTPPALRPRATRAPGHRLIRPPPPAPASVHRSSDRFRAHRRRPRAPRARRIDAAELAVAYVGTGSTSPPGSRRATSLLHHGPGGRLHAQLERARSRASLPLVLVDADAAPSSAGPPFRASCTGRSRARTSATGSTRSSTAAGWRPRWSVRSWGRRATTSGSIACRRRRSPTTPVPTGARAQRLRADRVAPRYLKIAGRWQDHDFSRASCTTERRPRKRRGRRYRRATRGPTITLWTPTRRGRCCASPPTPRSPPR